MKRARAAALAFLLPAFPCRAQQDVSAATRTRDLTYLVNQVAHVAPYFFAQLDPAQFQRAVDALTVKIPTATDSEFYVGLAQLAAMPGDMHTNLFLNSSAAGFTSFPLEFRWLDDGLFLVGAGGAYSSMLGTQVVAVEGVPIAQVVQQLGTTFAHANDQDLHVTASTYLRGQQILQGLHIAPVASTTEFTFQTLAGTQFTLPVSAKAGGITMLDPPLSQGPWPDYLNYGNAYTGVISNSFFYSAPNRMLFAKYNTCEDLPGAPVSDFNTGVLAALDANPVDTLVIDFRGNGGGNEFLLFPLGAVCLSGSRRSGRTRTSGYIW